MLDELISAYGNRFIIAALGVSLALLCLFAILWLLRHRPPSPFVRGGKNRQPRLQVLDAAAIDARRRLVLVRRDNIEHLVMIGGPTDIVIESGIGEERQYVSVQEVPVSAQETLTAPRPVETVPPQKAVAAPAETPRVIPEPLQEKAELAAPVAVAIAPVADAALPTPPAVVAAPEPAPAPAPASPAPLMVEVGVVPPSFPVEDNDSPPTAPTPDIGEILEKARERVLSERREPAAPVPPPPAAPAVEAVQSAATSAKSDFERVLEEEMALHLEKTTSGADYAPPGRQAAPTVMPQQPVSAPAMMVQSPLRASPLAAPAGAGRNRSGDEPNLQKEIARIFGEMTVTRNE